MLSFKRTRHLHSALVLASEGWREAWQLATLPQGNQELLVVRDKLGCWSEEWTQSMLIPLRTRSKVTWFSVAARRPLDWSHRSWKSSLNFVLSSFFFLIIHHHHLLLPVSFALDSEWTVKPISLLPLNYPVWNQKLLFWHTIFAGFSSALLVKLSNLHYWHHVILCLCLLHENWEVKRACEH